jgi:hypothetical protein
MAGHGRAGCERPRAVGSGGHRVRGGVRGDEFAGAVGARRSRSHRLSCTRWSTRIWVGTGVNFHRKVALGTWKLVVVVEYRECLGAVRARRWWKRRRRR